MTSVKRDWVPVPANEPCPNKILKAMAVGAAVGLAAVVAGVHFRGASTSASQNTSRIFRRMALETLPMAVGGAAVYSGLSCAMESNTGKRSWQNQFIAGAVTGALVAGTKKQSAVAGVIGGFVFGVAAATPDLLDASQPAASVVFTDPRERPFGIAPGVGSVTAAAAASAATVDTHTKVTNALLR